MHVPDPTPATPLSHREFVQRLLDDPLDLSVVASPSTNFVVVDLGSETVAASLYSKTQAPACVVVGFDPAEKAGHLDADLPDYIDVVAYSDDDLSILNTRISANPLASMMLAQLLRQSLELSVGQALLAESLAYSSLQHGAEFARFYDQRTQRTAPKVETAPEPTVLVAREDDSLLVQLNCPAKHNAYSARMRDELCEALQLARLDESIDRVVLSGAGESFCAGGDLDEFGLARDASIAHFSRTTQSAAALLNQLAPRVRVELKGACIGAGIELPAFASRVCAASSSFFQLPEVALGLVPGAGGTVSLPRRIGRRRTAWLGLSGQRIDAKQALACGLVDHVDG